MVDVIPFRRRKPFRKQERVEGQTQSDFYTVSDVLYFAGCAESGSEHPIGRSIVSHAKASLGSSFSISVAPQVLSLSLLSLLSHLFIYTFLLFAGNEGSGGERSHMHRR